MHQVFYLGRFTTKMGPSLRALDAASGLIADPDVAAEQAAWTSQAEQRGRRMRRATNSVLT